MSELLNVALNRNQDVDYSHYIPKANFVTILLNNHHLVAINNGTNNQSAFGQYGNIKSANGWSTYADHILEEGQTPNRMMLAKFNSAKTEEVKGDELYKDKNR